MTCGKPSLSSCWLFAWLTQIYESVKPVRGNGRLLWHRLGAKTIDLINQNVHVEAVRDDIEALVLDADVLDGILKDGNPGKKAREVERGRKWKRLPPNLVPKPPDFAFDHRLFQ